MNLKVAILAILLGVHSSVALSTFTQLCNRHHPPRISTTFSSFQTETLYPLNTNSHLSSLLSHGSNLESMFCHYEFACLRNHKWNQTIPVPSVSGLGHLACLQGSSMLQPVSEFHPFLGLNNIPLHIGPSFCLSIHLLVDIWVVSTSAAF